MKFGKKFFIVLGLVAILASLFVTVASAQGFTNEFTALQVDKYSVESAPPLMTLEFVGNMPCSGSVIPSNSVVGKNIYINIGTPKDIQPWMYVPAQTFTESFSFTNLVPGASYTVYINQDSKVKGLRTFTFVVPQFSKPY